MNQKDRLWKYLNKESINAGNPITVDVLSVPIADNLAVIADELTAIRKILEGKNENSGTERSDSEGVSGMEGSSIDA